MASERTIPPWHWVIKVHNQIFKMFATFNFNVITASLFFKSIMTSSSFEACKKVPGISIMTI